MSSRPRHPGAVAARCLARLASVATTTLLVLAFAVGPATSEPSAVPGGARTSPAARVAVVDTNDSAVDESAVLGWAGQRPVAPGDRMVAARPSTGTVLAQAASIDQVLTNIRNLILGVACGVPKPGHGD
jgi:hypothetical protein